MDTLGFLKYHSLECDGYAADVIFQGTAIGINYKMAVKFAAHFGLDPEDVLCATHEPIDLLLGVDAAGLLLDKVMQLNGRDVKPAPWAPRIFLYGSDASCKFSLVGRMNVNYPVDNIRDRFSAQGVFYFSSQEKYASCEQILLAGSYTHHVGAGNSSVSHAEPPARQLKQTKKCNPTPPQMFSPQMT